MNRPLEFAVLDEEPSRCDFLLVYDEAGMVIDTVYLVAADTNLTISFESKPVLVSKIEFKRWRP